MFDPETVAAMRAHAAAEYAEGREACGLVLAGRYVAQRNCADDPRQDFRINPEAVAAALAGGTLEAVVHSHLDGPDCPSRLDMERQINSRVPWGIIIVHRGHADDPFWFGDQVPAPPLIGRRFRHGVTDCYALVRDYYRLEQGISLPNLARDDAWWESGETMLEDHFAEFGFTRIDEREVRAGDSVLAAIASMHNRRTRVTNHCGVYLGNGLVLHHLGNQLSARTPIERYRPYITHYLRYIR